MLSPPFLQFTPIPSPLGQIYSLKGICGCFDYCCWDYQPSVGSLTHFLAHRSLSAAGIITMGSENPFGQMPLETTLYQFAQPGELHSILESYENFPLNSSWPTENQLGLELITEGFSSHQWAPEAGSRLNVATPRIRWKRGYLKMSPGSCLPRTTGTLVKHADCQARFQAYSFTVSYRTPVFITPENHCLFWLREI